MSEPTPIPGQRLVLADGRGALRATWHPDGGVVVISLWRGDRCFGTFRAAPAEVSALIGFLANALVSGAPPSGWADTA
ncbi:MAG TPA: hypothetical protein VF954_04860 [Acidimicrobiales bacterium]